MPSTNQSKRGRKATYQSLDERQQAKNARRREARRQQQAVRRDSHLNAVFHVATDASLHIRRQEEAHYIVNVWDDVHFPIEDEFQGLLPPPSPSLGSASTDMSEPDIVELDVQEPIIEENRQQEEPEDEAVIPEMDVEPSHPTLIEKLGLRLANQLIQFQGCCKDCHDQSTREHVEEHESHCSLQSYLNEAADDDLSNCPDVLSCGTIARPEDGLATIMTTAQKRWVYSGVGGVIETPKHICLAEGDAQTRTAQIEFDIDSITGFTSSLGIAKGGIRWNVMQMPVSDLQSSLHLSHRRIHYSDNHGHPHSVLMPVHEIPHYTLGRLVGFEDVSLYLLFPRLYRENQQTSRLLDEDFQTWMDRILLPAIYQHHSSTQTQHYPSSYQHGKCNSTARGIESRARKVDALPREQLLMQFVPPDKLHDIWETIERTVEEPGLQQFKDVTILLHAKNLKTLIKGPTWADMIARFKRYWLSMVDEAYVSADFYYDIGKETCPCFSYLSTRDITGCPPAETLLWKKCCLESYSTWCRDGESAALSKKVFYPTAMLEDTASMGIEPSTKSQLRASGLLYSQFYASVKEVFAAGNQYPFTNAAIETLALDTKLRKTWQHVGGGLSHDPIALIKAYLYAKARCHHGLQGSMQKSFGIREEHRVSKELFEAIDRGLEDLNAHDQRLVLDGDGLPYFSHPSITVLSWYRWTINKFCAGFEMVYSLNEGQWVTWEHTRVMLMFLRCLRFAYGSGHPREAAGCWRDIRYAPNAHEPDGLRRMEGLGFEVTMPKYGYAWFLEKIDWETMTFKAPHAQYMIFNNPSMQDAYRARYGQVRDVREDFIRINKIQQLMTEFGATVECQVLLEDVLRQMCLCAFRKDVFQHIKQLLKKAHMAEALAGKVPLCWTSLNRVLRRQHSPPHLVTGKRLSVKSVEVLFAWLWEWKDDHFQRTHWEEKPYRMLYQRSFQMVSLARGKDHGREWKKKLRSSFLQSHWLLPYPQGDRFMKGRKGAQQVSWWSSYHAGVHAYYRNEEAQRELPSPLPSSHIGHYPLDGWMMSKDSQEYMPYEIRPEESLVDLSEAVLYEHVSQLAADAQLHREAPLVRDAMDVSDAAESNLYSVDVGRDKRPLTSGRKYGFPSIDEASLKSTARVMQMEVALEQTREEERALRYRSRRRRMDEREDREEGQLEDEGEGSDDMTSDEDDIRRRHRERAQRVQRTEEELRAVREEDAWRQQACQRAARQRRWEEGRKAEGRRLQQAQLEIERRQRLIAQDLQEKQAELRAQELRARERLRAGSYKRTGTGKERGPCTVILEPNLP